MRPPAATVRTFGTVLSARINRRIGTATRQPEKAMTMDETVSTATVRYPTAWEFDALLADGSTVHVRPIERSDAETLRAFHETLSPETVYRRFFGPRPHLSDAEVTRFTTV